MSTQSTPAGSAPNWGMRLEPVDPDVTSTCHACVGLNREIPPESELAKEREPRESPYIIDSPRSLLRQVRILGLNTLSCELNILKQSSPQFHHKFHHHNFHHYFHHQLLIGRPNSFFGIGTRDVMNNLDYIPSPS